MRTTFRIAGLFVALGLSGMANASLVTIDFENLPNLPAQPNNFAAAGAMQTLGTAGLFSISGGVVIGNPTFLAAFPGQGSGPNLYGTADFADPSLLDTITLDLDPSQFVTNVNGKLFNGQAAPENYAVQFFSGLMSLGSIPFNNIADDASTSAFANFSLSSSLLLPITRVTFRTPNAATNGWDFFVDSINFTTNLGNPNPTPEPSTLALVPVGLLLIRYMRRKPAIKLEELG